MDIIKEFDEYLAERNENAFSYAMRTVENFVQWAESRGYLSAAQHSVQRTGCTCPRFESNGTKVFPMRECDGCRETANR